MMKNKDNLIEFVFGAAAAVVIIGGAYFVRDQLRDEEHLQSSEEQVQTTSVRSGARKELTVGNVSNDLAEIHKKFERIGIVPKSFEWKDIKIYGEQTQYYVTLFQLTQSLPPHGVVDDATWRALQSPKRIAAEQISQAKSTIPLDEGFRIEDIYYSPTFQKVAYLTFNGGPDPVHTEQIISILEKYDAGATFFVTGKRVSAYPEIAKKIPSENRNIGIMTYHNIDQSAETAERIREEIAASREAVIWATTQTPLCFRPSVDAVATAVRGKINAISSRPVLWDVDPQDWNLPGADKISAHVQTYTQHAEVIRLHDGGGNRTQTVIALESILKSMTKDGWKFNALPNCF